MLSAEKITRRNAWRYYVRGVAFGDGRRPVGQSLKDAQEQAGLPPGRWMGLGLAALGLSAGSVVSERQLELMFGDLRHPDADRIERERLEAGDAPEAARRATALGQPIEETEQRGAIPLLGIDFTFRAQASLIVLWALGDEETQRVIEKAHERAIQTALRWLEEEVAEVRWSSGRKRAKPPGLVVAAFKHFENRDGFPLLHTHCLVLNRAQRPDGAWYALDTRRLLRTVVAAGTLYTLAMTTEVCETLGLATVPREVTPGLRPVMEIAGVDQELIDWSSTRRQRIEQALEGITAQYVKEHGRLPDERARHGLGWWAAQNTRPQKKTPKLLEQLRAWWKASAILRFGQEKIDGLLQRCRTDGSVIRARISPRVDTVLAAVDVAAIVYTVRRIFNRHHILAEARRHLLETLRGRAFAPGLDTSIAEQALARHSRRLTAVREDRPDPAPELLNYTGDFAWPKRWWIAGADGQPPRESSRYERAQVASLAVQKAIRAARTTLPTMPAGAPAETGTATLTEGTVLGEHDPAPPHAVDHSDRGVALTPKRRADAVHTHQQAAMPQEHLEGRTTDPATWLRTPENLARLAKFNLDADARRRLLERTQPDPEADAAAPAPVDQRQHRVPGPGQGGGAAPRR
ncbi:MobF family relaxase [Streptomyces zaomyceticus]|uniref:MobF family relaxase n=1 Tax=Streptomyces zaomyceticus TaxID=68286 RepID=UPI002E0DF126|nr:relaxase domain-containing protein [Streptomyces zaomyceticus]